MQDFQSLTGELAAALPQCHGTAWENSGRPGVVQKIHLFISSACAVTAVALGVIQTFDLTRSSPPVAAGDGG